MHRVGSFAGHLSPNTTGTSAAPGAAAAPQPSATPVELLTEDAVKGFITDGFLVLQPEDVPGGREQFASSFLAKARSISGPEAVGDATRSRDETLWAELTPEINAVLGAPSTQGALTSLLGPDYIGPPGNSLMHVSQPSDQTFHRDGTDHGPTMSTVRDHRCRHVIVMFYPIATTLDLGPTSVVPRSHYLGVDREGFHNSEERLTPLLRPPAGEDASQPAGEGGFWQRAASDDAELTAAQSLPEQDAARIANAVQLLGDSTLVEHKVTVPAGAIVICHIDLWHRASRRHPEADWRPMFAVRSVARVSDPSGPTARLWQQPSSSVEAHDTDAFAHIDAPSEHKAVWQQMYDYMCDAPPSSADAALDPSTLERETLDSNSEMVRLGSAYLLGELTAAGTPSSPMALRALQRLLLDPAETIRRAAAYGLTAAGPAALPWLNALLVSQVAVDSLPAAPQPNVDVKQGVLVQIVHAVAHCATHHGTSAELAAETVGAVQIAVRRAVTEIESLTESATPEELAEQEPWLHNMYQNDVPLNFAVIERRRTVAEGCVALGLLGARAVADGREDTAGLAAEALLEVAAAPEPGLSWAAFMTRASVVHNAALGLVRLTSDPGMSGAAIPAVHTGGGWADEARRDYHNESILQGMVQEAHRRGADRLGAGAQRGSTAALEGVLRRIEGACWSWERGGGPGAVAPPAGWSSYQILL